MKKMSFISAGVLLLSLSFGALADVNRLMSVTKNPMSPTYFEVTINDEGLLNGKYKGWCGDWSTLIGHDIFYRIKYYSSYSSEIPEGLVDHPENLDEVNWILNKRFVNKTSPMGLGIYTVGDVQLAVWSLLDDHYDASTVGPYSEARVTEIVNRANQEGSGYKPRCSDLIGIILAPKDQSTDEPVQTVLLEIPRHHFKKCVVPDDTTF